MESSVNISKYELEDFLGFKKEKFQEKLKLMKKAKNDELFLEDIRKIQEDFTKIDFE